MSKKRFLSIVLSAVMILSLACSALAVGQSGRYIGNSTVNGSIYQTYYQVDAQTRTGIEWDGNAVYSSFRYKQITVKTTSMLGDEKPYATFGTGRHFVTRPATAGMTGSVKIGDFKLSSDINKVIVKSSSLQAYNLTKATWQSSIEFSGMVWVK